LTVLLRLSTDRIVTGEGKPSYPGKPPGRLSVGRKRPKASRGEIRLAFSVVSSFCDSGVLDHAEDSTFPLKPPAGSQSSVPTIFRRPPYGNPVGDVRTCACADASRWRRP
jgi:hypothetical protein